MRGRRITSIGRPGDRHCCGALEERREIVDEIPLLHAGRHELVFRQHLLEHFEADVTVHHRFHGIRIEKLTAFHAESFLKHVLRIGRRAEE